MKGNPIAARVELSEKLVELAEHSSEAEMRASISRVYYACFHLAVVLFGNIAHGEMPKNIGTVNKSLAEDYDRLKTLRSLADYHPGFVQGEAFRFRDHMDLGRSVYDRLRQMVDDDER